MPESVDIRVPALDEERDVVDLTTSLIGVTGVRGVAADTERHVLTVAYDREFVNAAYLVDVVRKTGYPVATDEDSQVAERSEHAGRAADDGSRGAERSARGGEDVETLEVLGRLAAPVGEILEAAEPDEPDRVEDLEDPGTSL